MKFDPPPAPRRRDGSVHAPAESADASEQFAIDLNCSGGGDRSTPRTTGKPWLGIAIGLAVLIHLTADLVLMVARPWESAESSPESPLLFALAVPFAQASLIALLAATLRVPLYGRFVVAAIGICSVWFVAVSMLPHISMRDSVSAIWATWLATQLAVIMAAIAAQSFPRHLFAATRADADESARRRFQFGVGSLLIWITLIAILLGLGQTVAAQLGWNSAITEQPYFYFGPVLGIFNAVYALFVVFSLSRRRRTIIHVFIAGLTIATLSYFQPLILIFLFGDTGGIDRESTLILAGMQTTVLYVTLLPIRAIGRTND